MDGSVPLKNVRHEAFCRILAGPSPPNQTEAWCQSASAVGREISTVSAAQRVSASRTHAKKEVRDRIAYLRHARFHDQPTPQKISSAKLDELMEECTQALMQAASAAIQAGVKPAQVAQIRHKIVVHAGRSERLNKRTPDRTEDNYPIELPELSVCKCA